MPRIVNGRPLKSINQYYNKRKAELQSKLKDSRFTARMERLTNKRTRRIDHYLHTASRRIIGLLIAEGIGTLVIGKNPNWKQEVYCGKRVKRGLFRASTGRHINADVNGSYNIVRKVVPDAFGQRDRGCVVHPTRLAV